ncbi:MAG: hypothetical protein IJL91_05200 [Bacteroidales bacterium]|nr:hypothetical protein [Bacteroidales bacterium]MBQ6577127.1 hypothetical protein [Bacteroidales bacterium]
MDKLSDDQKRVLKAVGIFLPCYGILAPLLAVLFGKPFAWENIFTSLLSAVIVGLLSLPFIFWGMKVPTKNDDAPKEDNK